MVLTTRLCDTDPHGGTGADVLQLHLDELCRRYTEASHRRIEALRVADRDGFDEANRQKRAIHDEWIAILENYSENCVRDGLNRRGYEGISSVCREEPHQTAAPRRRVQRHQR